MWTPLHFAVWHNEKKIVLRLLEFGANVEARRQGGYTVLHHAVESGNEEVVKLLLDHGARLEAQVKGSKKTALHIAAEKGHDRIVKLLIDRGANIEATDGAGKTALQLMNESLSCGAVMKHYISSIFRKSSAAAALLTASKTGPPCYNLTLKNTSKPKPVWKYQVNKY